MLSSAKPIISFGKMPIANGFLTPDQFENEYFFELAVSFCEETKLFRLIEQLDPKRLFHENYAFFSGTSRKMGEHFEKMAHHYMDHFIPDRRNAFVVEIGCNDGIMLRHMAKAGIPHLGIEPSFNVAELARQQGVNTISEFFGKETAEKVSEKYGKADLVSAANVLCHIPDLLSVRQGVDLLLKETGVFVFEDPYLGDVIQKTSYDQVYDEHVYLFSVLSVARAFSPLEIFHVEPQRTHGGSMRYYLGRRGAHWVQDSVKKQMDYELTLGLDKLETYKQFARNCEKNKQDFVRLLMQLKAEGKRVVGYAATSKSTTVLNYCGIGADLIECICDTTPIKQGKFSPGMHIPIRSFDYFYENPPDYAVLFAWNHASEIFAKEKNFVQNGGKWIVFVPEVKVLESIDDQVRYAV
jgi:methylation protein EvaC